VTVREQGLSFVPCKEHYEITRTLRTDDCSSSDGGVSKMVNDPEKRFTSKVMIDIARDKSERKHILRLQQLGTFPQREILPAYVNHLYPQ
jgi:hypothetical protein